MKNENSHIADDFADLIAAKVAELLREEGLLSPQPQEPCRDGLPTLYTIEEVCERLKVSKPTLDRHRKSGYIKASHYVGRSPRFTEQDIIDYLGKFNGN